MDTNEIVTIEGWRCEQTEFMNSALCCSRGEDTEVNCGAEGIDIAINGGYGYETYSAGCSIPMPVVIRMLRAAGYTVTRAPE